MNSPDRAKVFAAKARVFEQFPDWKPYLLYQSPNYKLRVGNFKTQEEAQDAMKQLSKLFPSGIYVIPDVIELKLSDLPKADTTECNHVERKDPAAGEAICARLYFDPASPACPSGVKLSGVPDLSIRPGEIVVYSGFHSR